MGKVISFNQARKKIAKVKKQKLAQENIAKHGQNKLTRSLIKRKKTMVKTYLDDHKLDDEDDKGADQP